MDDEKQDASYFNFGGFSHDDMHPTLDRNGSVPNTKSIKVNSINDFQIYFEQWTSSGISGLQEKHTKTNCVQNRTIQHPIVQGQQKKDTVTQGCFCHNPWLEVEVHPPRLHH